LKALLRKLAERTVAGLIAALEGSATTLFKSKECANYFEACGYDPAELLELNSTSADSALAASNTKSRRA
jgi:hypothetical protein